MSTVKILSAFMILLSVYSCGKSEQKNIQTSSDKTISNSDVTKDTCDSPDANIDCSFRNMPADLTNILTISKPGEPGEKIIISGNIFHSDSTTPYKDVIIYAYQTDSSGYYSKKGNETGAQKWQGHLHGWCVTDSNGYYEIHTIRPGRYPSNDFPAHIHPVIKLPDDSKPFYINDFVFNDDSLVNEKYISSLQYPGGTGVVELIISEGGILRAHRNIILPD
jgi:protocatechuate 3,4-dioxygenase beta subunit